MLRCLLVLFVSLALATAALAAEAGKPVKKKPVKKKGYNYERSKYKSRDLASPEGHSYRFNERGEPVFPKKKSAKKKRAEPPEETLQDRACGPEENCAAKSSEADAL